MSDRPILIWLFADVTERNNTGTNNGLVVGQVSYVVSTNTFYYCATAAAATSTWTATATGSGQTLAATLAVGNVTGGTAIEVSAGDPATFNENASVPGGAPAAGKGVLWVKNDTPNTLWFTDDGGTDHQIGMGSGDVVGPGSATDNALVRFDTGSGKLVQDSVAILSDTGDLSGINDITLSGTVDGRDVAADGTALDAHIADVANPHVTTLALSLSAGNTTGGTGIEVSVGDPVTLNENAAVPGGAPGVGKGKIWVRSDTPNVLIFTDDAGTDTVLGGPGSIPTLSQVLGAGNTTSGDDINVTGASTIIFGTTSTTLDDTSGTFTVATADAQGVVVDTSGGAGPITLTTGGNPINIDYATWPAADGTAGYVLSTDGLGALSWVSNAATPSWDAVLAVGNTSGGTDVEVSAGDALLLVENAAVPWVAVATKGALWVKNDGPNTLYFTDDAGTDWLIGGSGAGTLAQVLTAGNTTGGTDIELTSGDKIVSADGSAGPGATLALLAGTGDAGANGGEVTITGGAPGAGGSHGGYVTIQGGGGLGGGVDAGTVFIYGGTGPSTGAGNTGDVLIAGGQTTRAGEPGGDVTVQGGSGGSVAAAGGTTIIRGGAAGTGGAISGGVTIDTPNAVGSGNAAGTILLAPGNGVAGNASGGWIQLYAGDSTGTTAGGALDFKAGPGSATGTGGEVIISAGDTSGAGTGGSINLNVGTTTGGTDGTVEIAGATNIVGDVDITGKLTVSGLIDPTGLVLTEQAADPASTGAGEGTFWVKNDAPTTAWFTDDGGTDHQLNYVGADDLATVLSNGNTTGGTTIEISTGDYVEGEPAWLYSTTPAANRVQQFTARTTIAADAADATLAVAYSLTSNETAVMLRGDVTGVGLSDADNLVRGTFEGTWYRSGGTVSAGVTTITSQGINGATTDDPAWTISVDISGDDIRIRITSADSGGTNTTIAYVANWTAQLIS